MAASWVKFFNTAGIPSPAAATYAHIFVENRIQDDMIMDLNKDYLREMGITPMGDIIAILRHSRTVSEQCAREKVLGSENKATTDRAPSSSTLTLNASSTSNTKFNINNSTKDFHKAIKHVLPEHEGKYKIKLSTDSTERIKDIHDRRDKLFASSESSSNKANVFTRLRTNALLDKKHDDSNEAIVSSSETSDINSLRVNVRGMNNTGAVKRSISKSSISSSVFQRLGEKTDSFKHIKPILKNSTGIVKVKNTQETSVMRSQKQKVILVSKVPVKSGDSNEEDSDIDYDTESDCVDDSDAMDCDEQPVGKNVKFASIAEVREFSTPQDNHFYKNSKKLSRNIKSRLGAVSRIHSAKKTYNFKTSTPAVQISPVKGRLIRLKSDGLLSPQDLPVHHRLGNVKKTNLENRFQDRDSRYYSFKSISPQSRTNKVKSVFDRLGYNK